MPCSAGLPCGAEGAVPPAEPWRPGPVGELLRSRESRSVGRGCLSVYQTFFDRTAEDFDTLSHDIPFSGLCPFIVCSFEKEISFLLGFMTVAGIYVEKWTVNVMRMTAVCD